MLSWWLDDPFWLAMGQAAVAGAVALVALLVARRVGIRLLGESSMAMARGFVQVLGVGLVLGYLLSAPWWGGALVLVAMFFAASLMASRRARDIPGAFRISLLALSLGAGSVVVLMVVTGVIRYEVWNLVPVGSMLLANSMTSTVQLLERVRSDVASNRGLVETALALGATPAHAMRPYVAAAVRAAVIPQVNTMAALGIVFLPGMMSGMVLAGSDPKVAALYQFAIIAMIMAAGALTTLIAGSLVRGAFFTPREQLVALGRAPQR